MSKLINGLLGNSKQKIGNLVTYVAKGQQIARTKAANIANPRTAKQMNQRTKLANMVAFFRANKSWMEKLAFESKPVALSVYNAFVKANSGDVYVHLTKQQAAQHCAIVAPYQVTLGSLPSIEVNKVSDFFQTNLSLPSGVSTLRTVADLSAALISANNGVSEGMQLSVIVNYQSQTNGNYYIILRAYEIILSTSDTRNLSEVVDTAFVVNSDSYLSFNSEGAGVLGFAYILSKTVDNKTFVSSQALVLTDSSLYDTFHAQADAAASSYGVSAEPFLAAGYQEEPASNPEVPVTQSIISLNGKTAGSYFGNLEAGLMDVILAAPVASDASLAQEFWINGEAGYSAIPNATVQPSGGNVLVSIPENTYQAPLIGYKLTIDGVTYEITFSATLEG